MEDTEGTVVYTYSNVVITTSVIIVDDIEIPIDQVANVDYEVNFPWFGWGIFIFPAIFGFFGYFLSEIYFGEGAVWWAVGLTVLFIALGAGAFFLLFMAAYWRDWWGIRDRRYRYLLKVKTADKEIGFYVDSGTEAELIVDKIKALKLLRR